MHPDLQQQSVSEVHAHVRDAFLVILAATLVHVFLLWLPGINLEWVFADAAKYFDCSDPLLLKRYFLLEANTLGMPFLAFALHHVLPFLTYGVVLRVLSASSFLFLGYSLLRLHFLLQRDYNPAILLAVAFLNPLIWTFGGRGTSDLFPAALTLFAITLFWQPNSSPVRLAIAITIYGIAITLKYHAVLLLPLIALERLTRPGATIGKMVVRVCLIVFLILVIPVCYILLAKRAYGFWLAPPKFRAMHGLDLHFSGIIMNILGYAAYLSLLLLPFSLSVVWGRFNTTRKALSTIVVALLIFGAGAYCVRVGDEMRFGPLDAYVNPRIYSGVFLVFAAIFVLLSKEMLRDAATQSARRYLICMFLGVLIFIGLLSLARPAQRYLLFVLPLSYFFVIDKRRGGKYLAGIAILFYVILNVFITLNQVATGAVSQQMLQQITARGLLDDTDPGKIVIGNAGDRFPDLNGAAKKHYTVIGGSSPNAIVTVESHPAPMVHKVLSLVRHEDAPASSDDSR